MDLLLAAAALLVIAATTAAYEGAEKNGKDRYGDDQVGSVLWLQDVLGYMHHHLNESRLRESYTESFRVCGCKIFGINSHLFRPR